MEQAPRKSKVGLIIVLVIIGLVVAGGIGLMVIVSSFLRSDEGHKLMGGISTTARVGGALPSIQRAFEAYAAAKNGDFPKTLDELKAYGANGKDLETVKQSMKYTKPPAGAPDDTVILDSGKIDFVENAEMRIQMTKNLKAWQMQRTPLDHKRGRFKFN